MQNRVTVAKQLEDDVFGFCKVAKKDKKPFEPGWSKKPYKWNDPNLQKWLDAGGNYGVLGGHGDLRVFDADELDRLEELEIISQMPETFTVRTPGRGGMHFYYICPGLGKKMALYDPEKTFTDETGKEKYVHVADLSSDGMQTVGPNSVRYFPGEEEEYRSYQVINNIPIAHITKEQLMEAIKVLRTSQKVEKVQGIEEPKDQQAGYNRWAETLKVEDVLLPDNITKDDREDSGEIQGSHPIHGSEGGHNFAINVKKNTWVCYRCTPPEGKGKKNCGGGPWELLGVREGIIDCDDCYSGWRRDQPEKWAAILKRAKDLGMAVPRLPDGDSMSEYRRDIIRYCVEVIMGSEFVKTPESGEIYIYESGAYRPGGEAKLAALIEQLGDGQTTNTVVAEVLGRIRRLTGCDFLDFDSDPYRLCVKNGILNLQTGQMEPHSPDFLTVIQLPVEFKPGADCPKIKEFMTQVVREKDLPLMEEMAGYSLLRDYPFHKAFLLLGEGRNGKSTWVNLLLNLVGLNNCCSVALQHLGRRFKKAEMKGKLINFYTDLPEITMAVTDEFKIVTSGDPISIERKYFDPETVRLTAKHIYSANALPKSMDESYGFFSRLIMIDFPNRFVEGVNMDPHLMEKLTTPEELSGLLNLAISGLRRLQKAGRFSYSKNVEEVAAEYKMKSSPVFTIADFMTAATLKDSKEAALKDDLYLAYKGWCLETGEEEIIHSKDELCRVIYKGYAVTETQITVGENKRKRALRGICLSEEGNRLADLGMSITPIPELSGQTKVLA